MPYTASLLDSPKERLTLMRAACGAHHLDLLWDTGASTTTITREAAQRLGLDVNEPTSEDGTPRVLIPSLSLGPFDWTGLYVRIRDLPNSEHNHGRPLDGILGTDFMGTHAWLFDMPQRSFGLTTSGHPCVQTWCEGAVEMALRPQVITGGSVWATDALLDDRGPVCASIDTGAQRTVLNQAAGDWLDADSPREPIELSSDTVNAAASYRTRARSIQLGSMVFESPLVAVCEDIFLVAPDLLGQPAILLGGDVFGAHRFGFDFGQQRFWIHPDEG